MAKARVLVVDDSVVMRKMIGDVIESDADLTVAGVAANGKIALQKIPQVNPDLVTLDVEMPEMDGIETLRELRKDYPKLPVVMFSSLTEKGAVTTLEALALGASDYLAKPAEKDFQASQNYIRSQLVPKVRVLCRHVIGHECVRELVNRGPAPTPGAFKKQHAIDIVTIGTSTGGPNALVDFFKQIPADFPLPIVLVQHMPPVFTKMLAERLTKCGTVECFEAEEGMKIENGKAYIAPGGLHLEVARSGVDVVARLTEAPPENSCRPAADVLFRSVVEVYGKGTLAVVMTGMGMDGCRGCEKIRDAGGVIYVQDEATSVVWGMPGYVANEGLADQILPIESLGVEVNRHVQQVNRTPVHG